MARSAPPKRPDMIDPHLKDRTGYTCDGHGRIERNTWIPYRSATKPCPICVKRWDALE